jgi:formamidopyrimidine-DNA glycosylase
LLNQAVIAGIGNIYADESLFRAGIRPDRPGRLVSPERLANLRLRLADVLTEAIAACGSSIRDYRTANGDAGAFQKAFKVYGRGGQACPDCGRKLRAIKVAGRTTVFCPHCQK